MKIACGSVSYDPPPLTLTLSLHKNATKSNWGCRDSRNRQEHFTNHQGSEGTKLLIPALKIDFHRVLLYRGHF